MSKKVVIVGGGCAGLFAALTLAKQAKVTLISGSLLGGESSSVKAQGGVAAAVGAEDSYQSHTADTLVAGAGITDENVAREITLAAPKYMQILRDLGVRFKTDAKGNYELSREACHSCRRVLKAKSSDGFGKELMRALTEEVLKNREIDVIENSIAIRILKSEGIAIGVVLDDGSEIRADSVVLATGGLGGLFSSTTNPLSSVGRGIAMAAIAGATLSDMEFVQFHPTALDIGEDPAPLATEALRGEGAYLVNDLGERFMQAYHPMAELAPRDEVSRGIFAQMMNGRKVYLDCRHIELNSFDALLSACARAGLDPRKDLVPVKPAAHYHMGGIATDLKGRTSIKGLWACGEVAATGLHGANRLASNSLMEAIVMAAKTAEDIINSPFIEIKKKTDFHLANYSEEPMENDKQQIRNIMSEYLGVIRNRQGMLKALKLIDDISAKAEGKNIEVYDMAIVARLITVFALKREESRGGHCRSDFTQTRDDWKHRSFMTMSDVINKEYIYA